MSRIFLSSILMLLSLSVQAQFFVTPTDSIHEIIYADSTISIFQIDLVNETTDSLNLTWKLIEEEVTEGWNYNLCDLGECYVGVPNSAEMQAFGPGDAGFLKMLVNPLSIEGYGFWHFWVYPSNDPDNFVELYFSINASLKSGVIEEETQFILAPNPAQDIVKVISNHPLDCVQLSGLNGSLIKELKPQIQFYDLSDIPPGIYFISASNETGRMIQKLVIK